MTPAQALRTMVAGTGVTVSITGPASAALVSGAANAGSGGAVLAGAISLDTIDVQGAGNPNSTMSLPPAYAGGQVARGGQLGMLGNRDMMDTPFHQTNYTRKLIENQQARSIAEVLSNDPSVAKIYDTGGGFGKEQWAIRGVGANAHNVSFGGLFGITQSLDSATAVETIERVEVLKGASTLLNGLPPTQGAHLGTVNLVPKRAGDEPLIAFTPNYAMNSQFGGHLDAGQRFGDNKEFGVRFNGVYRSGDTPIDYNSRETRVAALGLDYRGETVRLSADFGYQYLNTRGNRAPVTVALDAPVPMPPHTTHNWVQPWEYHKVESKYATTRGEWDITENVTAYAAFGRGKSGVRVAEYYPTLVDAVGTMAASSAYQYIYFRHATTAETGLRGHVETGPVKHAVALAAGWGRENYGDNDGDDWNGSAVLPATNLYNPVYFPQPNFPRLGDPASAPISSRTENLGFTLADTMSALDERIQLMLGIRHQRVKRRSFSSGSQYDDGALSPAAALIVKPWQNVSLYANYMEALEAGQIAPTNAVNVGEVFPPFKTTQSEVGAKVDFGHIAATLAAFTATRPTYGRDPDTLIFGEVGKTRYQGIEFTTFGQATDSIRFVGGFTFLDPRLIETPDGTNIGNRIVGTPRYRATLSLDWDTPFIEGLTLGGMAQWQSFSFLDNANMQKVDGWYRFDLNASYTIRQPGWKPIIVRASLRNVLDRSYWASSYWQLGLSEPRTFLLSTTFQF
ncbi:TonB-dependent receptor [Nitrobacter winogradskyi]|nr:TonB-dependent siderophore receptor [Nitrobacter winogradskyi]